VPFSNYGLELLYDLIEIRRIHFEKMQMQILHNKFPSY
jgi:hypothetical protein